MTNMSQHANRPAGRALLLLVLAVLVGLLAMHGLAPGALPADHADAGTGHGVAAPAIGAPAAVAEQDDHACAHAADGHDTGGHVSHADTTCAASGLSSTYLPPALTPAVYGQAAEPEAGATAPDGAAESSRAPPDLAQLQLLRI